MAMQATGDRGVRSFINVTPLIDVLLVLLIIFMVIQPAAQRGLDTLVPQPPKSNQAEADPRTVVVAIDGTSAAPIYRLNGQQIELPDLRMRLEHLTQSSGRRTIFVRGAAALDYAAITPVLDVARAAGEEQIGILTPATLRSW